MNEKEKKKVARKAKKLAKKTKKVAKKMGWKKFTLLVIIIVAILIGGFFGYSYYKYKDPMYLLNELLKPQEQQEQQDTTRPDDEPGVFEHQLYEKFMKDKDTMTVNGLTFKFPNMSYDEYDKGIKLGSTSKPILQDNQWYIETTFPETIINDFEFTIANNEKGTTYYTVDFNGIKKTGNDTNTESTTIKFNNINIKTTNLKLSLYNTKGGYLKSLRIKFENPTFNVSKDKVIFNEVKPGQGEVPKTNFAVISKEQYYKDIDFSSVGPNLRKALNVRINKGKELNTYGDARYMLIYTDERVDQKGVLYSIYDGNKIKPEWSDTVWNREHVWPCSKMEINGLPARPGTSDRDHRSDLHNLRALTRSLNIYRNNKYFALKDEGDVAFFPNKSIDPKDDFRGDVARIIFYMELCYEGLEIVEKPTATGHQMGQLSLLKKWNEEDPVDAFEIQRNNRIFEYQGNRNPFIDHPEIVNKLYA